QLEPNSTAAMKQAQHFRSSDHSRIAPTRSSRCSFLKASFSLAPNNHLLKISPFRTTVCPHKQALSGSFGQLGKEVHAHSEEELGMTPAAASSSAVKVERWRWLLYVGLAFFGALLTFVGARAQQQATDTATFRKLIDNYCTAWSSGNPDNAAKFYAKDQGLIFYDLAPFSYHSWKEYREGVQKEFFDNTAAASLT